ncbi:MAG: 1-acyl-sn-glycerol-3-phosphate acyltransferase [Tenericutes bacterium]|nr:1-acyl-sn-glycerol-3-phosphate acyltransferase [Mycoplasmatota bacterium]
MSLCKKLGALFILPVMWFSAHIYRRKSTKEKYERLQKWSAFFIKYLGFNIEVEGKDNIPKEGAVLFVSNHQGTLDPAVIISSIDTPMTFISKKENEKYLVFGTWATTIGVIFFNRETREGNIHMLREAAKRLKLGERLLIFPEGTRSWGSKMNAFKHGSLQPAYLSKATIVPITLNNSYNILNKKAKNKNIKITFGKPKYFNDYKKYSYEEMSDILFKEIDKNITHEKK